MRDVKSLAAEIEAVLRKHGLEKYEASTDGRLADLTSQIAAEIAALQSRVAEIEAVICDPVAVHLNMLRGTIVKPSIENIIHLYGRDALLEALQSRAFEDGARWMRERAEGVAREWMHFTGCRADENTDGLNPETRMYARGHYHARSAIAAGIAAFPLQPEGERSDA